MMPVRGPCPTIESLEALESGTASSPGLSTHLAECDACRALFMRIRTDNEFLRSFAKDGAFPVPVVASSPDFSIEISGYRIVREIHRGGQGVVFQAVQNRTRRDVAIKIIKQGPFATVTDRSRFEREIETLGRLNHPNIVAVHDAGVVGGFHYFVMNYIDGRPLDEAFDGLPRAGGGDEPAHSTDRLFLVRMLETFIKVCDAVHAAHLCGVIHRDLKPSNIRIDRAGEPHVLDFGLAKSVSAEPETTMTRTGQFVGSMPWASPEQVEGTSAKIDLRTDVYSLGVILYQLVAGRLPFDVGGSLRAAFDNILYREPLPPSAARAGASGRDDELDTIVLKCLSKDRERRYQSAGELARDLRRYLAGEPIEAKRDSALYVLRKNLARYRLRVAVAGVFVSLLGVVSLVMGFLYRHSARLEHEATHSAALLSDLLAYSSIEQGRLAGMLGNIERAERLLWDELLTRRVPGADAAAGILLNEPPGSPEAYWALWELYRRRPCRRRLQLAPPRPVNITVADDGMSLWAIDADGNVLKLDESGREIDAYHVRWPSSIGLGVVSANGKTTVKQDGDRLIIWRRGDMRPILELPDMPPFAPGRLSISRSGKRLAVRMEGRAAVWNIDSPDILDRFTDFESEAAAVALSTDEMRLAVRTRAGGLRIWSLESGEKIAATPDVNPLRLNAHQIGDLRFSPDDRYLADAWMETSGCIWDLSHDPPSAIPLAERNGNYRVQSFSPDSRRLAVGEWGGALRIFDVQTGRRLELLSIDRINDIAFTSDGRGLWTAGGVDLRLWEFGEDASCRILQFDNDVPQSIDVEPGGAAWWVGGSRGCLNRISSATGECSSIPCEPAALISCVAISPDGRRRAVANFAGVVRIENAQGFDMDHATDALVLAHPNSVNHVCFSRDGARLATTCEDHFVRVWRTADGALERELRGGVDRVPQVAFDPSGNRIVAATRDGKLRVWRLDTGESATWETGRGSIRTVCFSRDGRFLYSAGGDRVVVVWDARKAEPLASLAGHNREIYCLEVSRDDQMIASGDSDGTIRLWHAVLRRPLATLDGHTASVMSLRFSPDARTLASASLDGTVRLWDLSHYNDHVAGNLSAHLQRVNAEEIDSRREQAWRFWAEGMRTTTHR